jgi:Tol biopolymer transport system component
MCKKLFLVAALLAVCLAAKATTPGGKIAFVRIFASNESQLVVRNLDTGTAAVLLSTVGYPNFPNMRGILNPAWSHNAGTRWIVFIAWPNGSANELWAIKEDGTSLHQLSATNAGLYQSLSRDDNWFAYRSSMSANAIYVQPFDLSGGGTGLADTYGTATNIMPSAWSLANPYSGPTWSPDGMSIALGAGPSSGSPYDIMRMNLAFDASGQPSLASLVDLTNSPQTSELTGDWSNPSTGYPLGRIVYTQTGKVTVLNAVDPRSGSAVTLVDSKSARLSLAGDNGNWSPDASWVVFSAAVDTPGAYYHLYVVNANGSGVSVLTNPPPNAGDRMPAWRP